MKVTKEQYDKALTAIEKLQKAEAIAKVWEDARKAHPANFTQSDVLEVERDEAGRFFFKSSPKELDRGQPNAVRESA